MPDQTDTAAPALKEIFDRERLRQIAAETAAVCAGFDRERFLGLACDNRDALGIMQRMRQVAIALHHSLPGDFAENIATLRQLAPRIGHGFVCISLCEYVALYGQDHVDLSMDALKHLTRFGSAEFAIRPFLLADLDRTLRVMETWALDDDEHVRRLASEGCRPRLPWSFTLKALIDDPRPAAGILAALKSDPSLYVRKSVANHLNDITKDHPDLVLEWLSRWPLDDRHTAWIAKKALRTLIKNGDARALAIIGAGGRAELILGSFIVEPARISLGDRIRIDARLTSTADRPQRLVVDYAIHYVKKSGAASRKVFKLKELDLAPGASVGLSIGQTVRDFTTRKHHAGHHAVDLLVNGEIVGRTGFDLAL